MTFEVPTPKDIWTARKNAGMSQADLADKAGYSQYAISKIENGKSDPKLSTLRDLADALEQAD